MPRSSVAGKVWIICYFKALLACNLLGRVLDIGAGEGTYAKFLRQIHPAADWVGVEIWGPYVRKYALESLYDKVVIADARYVDYGLLGKFDLGLAGDVLEHMEKIEKKAHGRRGLMNAINWMNYRLSGDKTNPGPAAAPPRME